ncbi:hypothetical protein [uncultured Methanolobus sp.]|uniref:hypothetical protein n=1 Tax=uncultured Methanolobus sp. TaxID=218300 RepID=UPI0029C90220|nr:hypothetical protein [uncultured Methanolobus sp.]
MSNMYEEVDVAVNNEDVDDVHLKSAEAEYKDLKKYWSDLSWWERDEAIEAIMGYVEEYGPDSEAPAAWKERTSKLRVEAKKLYCENAPDRPSIREQVLDDKEKKLWYDGNPKLNWGRCMDAIKGLSHDEQVELAEYIGISFIDDSDVSQSLMCVTNRSLTAFYALRNRVGREHV